MANVYDLANELERAVRALPEYQAVLTAKAAIENDADAQVLWQDFLATQSKVQEMMQSGQMPSQEEQDEMSKLGEKIESNDLLKVYFDQQQRLSVYMSDIEKIVGQIAELDSKFAVIKGEQVSGFYKNLDQAMGNIIEEYNLNR